MDFYDTHAHSLLSFDSEEEPNNYLTDLTQTVALTEHLEFDYKYVEGGQLIPQFEQIIDWQNVWKKEGNQLLMGVEIGYSKGNANRLKQAIEPFEMDLLLLSSHHNNEYDFMDTKVAATPEEMMGSYLSQLEEAVDYFPDAQIFCHFDYGFRIFDLSPNEFNNYEEQLVAILQKVIQHNLAFELNSKSIFDYENRAMYEWLIPIYQSLGGTLFSIGSDAHKATDHYKKFGELIHILDQFGVKSVAQFHKQQLSNYPLTELKKKF